MIYLIVSRSVKCLMLKKKPFRSKKYRRWVSSLPCAVCGRIGASQCAHIKDGCGTAGAPDNQTLPLCCDTSNEQRGCHQKQHDGNERDWWNEHGGIEKAKQLAQGLYRIWRDEKDNPAREYTAGNLIYVFRRYL